MNENIDKNSIPTCGRNHSIADDNSDCDGETSNNKPQSALPTSHHEHSSIRRRDFSHRSRRQELGSSNAERTSLTATTSAVSIEALASSASDTTATTSMEEKQQQQQNETIERIANTEITQDRREKRREGRIGRIMRRSRCLPRSLSMERRVASLNARGTTRPVSEHQVSDDDEQNSVDDQRTQTVRASPNSPPTVSVRGHVSSARPDYVPPASTPGAFYQLGRPFGDFPEWFRRSSRRRLDARQRSDRSIASSSDATTAVRPRYQRQSSHRSNHGASTYSFSPLGPLSPSRLVSSNQNCHVSQGRLIFRSRMFSMSDRSLSYGHCTKPLPEAEPLDAEMVVYAQVQSEEGFDWLLWKLIFYTLFVFMLGMFIGRLSVQHQPI